MESGRGASTVEVNGEPGAAGSSADPTGPAEAAVRFRELEATSLILAALEAGNIDLARTLAQSLLDAPVDGVDGRRLRAQALTCLAHCDRIVSRPHRACETAREAAELFEEIGDVPGEATALVTLAHVTMLIGRNDEALEAALLSVELCDTSGPTPQAVLAYNCLGLAYCWVGDHVRADASLEAAVELAGRCIPGASAYQPRLNQVWVESSRLVGERHRLGRMQSLDRLEVLMADCRRLALAGAAVSVMPGIQDMGRTIALASASLLEIWRGDFTAANRTLADAVASVSLSRTWLQAFIHWCFAELAWARAEWPIAEQRLVAMRGTALAVEHVQLACMAELLLAQVFELQGNHAAAGSAYRSLRQREAQAMVDGMGSRKALVASRVRARRSERRLQQVLVASRQFEQWSMEDALTGIANRRHVERTLNERIERAALRRGTLSVAMIDVDRFKQVNDGFTHSVGDRVLKTVAAILTAHVRGNDLPARWAGDEFVILFDGAGIAEAESICSRIGDEVRTFHWGAVAPGLSVSVSIGVSEARHGDTAATVLQRSDESMYRRKSLVRPGN